MMAELTDTEQQEGLDNILEKEMSKREGSISPAERYPYEGERTRCMDEGDLIDKIFRVIVANVASLFTSGILFGILEATEVADISFYHPLQIVVFVLLASIWYKVFTKVGLFTGN